MPATNPPRRTMRLNSINRCGVKKRKNNCADGTINMAPIFKLHLSLCGDSGPRGIRTLATHTHRNFGDTCKKSRLHNIWEISSKPCTQDASTFLLMATKLPGRLRPTKAWNRAALWVPFCIPFIPMTLTDSWPCREVLPLPWIQFPTGADLTGADQVPHCDYADDIALTSNTAECLQFQLNKFHNYTRFKGLKVNTDKTKNMVFFSRIPTFTYDGTPLELVTHFKYLGHSHSWWKYAHSSWEDGRQLEARDS